MLTGCLIAVGILYLGTKTSPKRRGRQERRQYLQPLDGLRGNGTHSLGSVFADANHTLRKYLPNHSLSLVSATRRQQLKVMSSYKGDSESRKVARAVNRSVTLSAISFSFTVAGRLFYSPLTLIGVIGALYVARLLALSSYQSLFKEQRMTVDTLSTVVKIFFLLGGYYVFLSFSTLVWTINRKLLNAVKDSSRRNMIDVFRQQPTTVWLLLDGVEVEIPFEKLKQDDIVVVSTGESISVDGVIVKGAASVDQQVLTGESQPVEKTSGDSVFAMTVVLSGKIYVQVEKAGEETTAAQIGQILNQTAGDKTDMQLQAEVISDRTVLPTLLLGASAYSLISSLSALAILQSHFKYRLTMTSSVGILNYLNLTSRKGILVKDGRAFERLKQVDTVVFDKTGTLTEEQPQIGAIHTCDRYDESAVLQYAAAAEDKQTHPIARAIVQAAQKQGLTIPSIDAAEYMIGYGLTVTLDHHLIRVGSSRFMEMEGVSVLADMTQRQARCSSRGHALVLVARDDCVIGAIELHTTVRPEAKAVVEALASGYVSSTFIISGDHEAPTKALAAQLGIDHYFAETLPEDKADLIEYLQREGRSVCYVGDGINDAIAIKKADVSVSLRGASSVARDAAQVILIDDNLNQLLELFSLAKQFETTTQVGLAAVIVPHLVGTAGAIFFNFGLLQVLLCAQVGLWAGLFAAMMPLLQQRKDESIINMEETDRAVAYEAE